MPSLRRAALFLTPALSIAGLAVGLHVGARGTVVGAVMRGAPKAKGSDAFVWQLLTILDERTIRETIPMSGVTVRATARASGRESTWRGDTNADGVAEVRLDAPGVAAGDAIDVEITARDHEEPLAAGPVVWGTEPWQEAPPSPYVPPGKRAGDVGLDVVVAGERLVARYPVPLLVRATAPGGAPLAGVTIDAEPENGLDVTPAHAVTCANGWARVTASPLLQVATLGLKAHAPDGRAGEWYGALPVAPGGMVATVEGAPKAGEGFAVDVRGAVERMAYVEVDDTSGRAFAVATALVAGAQGASAHVDVPGMAAGWAWVTASSEPRGAEALSGSTLARAFDVGGAADGACDGIAERALHPAAGFPRFVAVDGFAERAPKDRAKRKKGLAIALGSLGVGGVLEMFLVVDAFVRARRDVKRAAEGLDDGEAEIVTPRANPLGLAAGLFAVALGFGLLAAILFWKV